MEWDCRNNGKSLQFHKSEVWGVWLPWASGQKPHRKWQQFMKKKKRTQLTLLIFTFSHWLLFWFVLHLSFSIELSKKWPWMNLLVIMDFDEVSQVSKTPIKSATVCSCWVTQNQKQILRRWSVYSNLTRFSPISAEQYTWVRLVVKADVVFLWLMLQSTFLLSVSQILILQYLKSIKMPCQNPSLTKNRFYSWNILF